MEQYNVSEAEESLLEFDDGHRPGATNIPTKVAAISSKTTEKFVSVFDDIHNDDWCKRIYKYSLIKRKPWGVYVPTSDALDSLLLPEDLWGLEPERAIALVTVREMIFKRGGALIGDDVKRIAGTSVWCLSSGEGDTVEYHIDYAELYRYETNIICPPIYAGTYHVTPFRDGELQGGDFMANLGGLEHYRRYGYKGRLADSSSLIEDIASGIEWMTVPYKFNRGIIHDGNLPHLASTITSIHSSSVHPLISQLRTSETPQMLLGSSIAAATAVPPTDITTGHQDTNTNTNTNTGGAGTGAVEGLRRVILGFNCFPQRVHECCRRATEHSDAFNRTIKLYQTVASLSQNNNTENSTDEDASAPRTGSACESAVVTPSQSFTVKDIMKNSALAKLIVLAARKVKAQRMATP